MSWIKEAKELITKNHSISIAGNTMINIDGTKYRADKLATFLVDNYESELDSKAVAAIYKGLSTKDHKDFNTLLTLLRKETFKDKGPRLYIQSKNFVYKDLALIRDVVSGESRTFSTKMDRLVDLDVDTWFDCLGKEVRESVPRILGTVKYNPRVEGSKKLVRHEGQEVYQFNSHILPEWRKNPIESPTLHPTFRRIINHLFTNKSSRRFALNWMYQMIVSRNETVLLLVSNMGTGKGIFSEVCELLVGESNFQKQTDGLKKNKFSGELKDKTLVYLDEFEVDDLGSERLKFWMNKTITVEFKGINVKRAIDNFASYIVSNNNISGNRIKPNDRRYSAPDVTNIPLLEVISQPEIDQFIKEINEEGSTALANIGWYILNNCEWDEYSNYVPYKGDWYYKLCINGLEEWKKFIIDAVYGRSKEKYKLSDLKYDYEDATGNRLFPGPTKLNTFLESYRDKDGEFIGGVDKSTRTPYLVPTSKYAPISTEFEEVIDI